MSFKQYKITNKPIVHVACGAPCRGVLMRQMLSRLEESLGQEGFQCDRCSRRVKYVPKKEDQ
jgi:hypothetical protein